MSLSVVLDSAQWIASCSAQEGVTVCAAAATGAAETLRHKMDAMPSWKDHEMNPKDPNDLTVSWIFVVDTLNFCFWSRTSTLFTVAFNGKTYTGYWALAAAVNRALSEGHAITDAQYMAEFTEEQAKHIFRSETEEPIPLLAQRVQVVREAGQMLLSKFGGLFSNCIRQANHSALALLDLIVTNFPSYNDQAMYHGKPVKLYKRAQILIAEIWACFEHTGLGRFDDIDSITMFADYRVPQILAHLGVIQYTDEVMDTLRRGDLLPSGHPLEVAIRGCSIWAVELIRREMAKDDSKQPQPGTTACVKNAITIDFFLWGWAKAHQSEIQHIPIHHTESIYY